MARSSFMARNQQSPAPKSLLHLDGKESQQIAAPIAISQIDSNVDE